MSEFLESLLEICGNCGFTFDSHNGSDYYSNMYKMSIPTGYCPGHEHKMDWDKGPETIFKSTGKYRKEN